MSSSLGIYFGPKVISVAETKGKKLLSSFSVPQSTVSAGELEEKVPAEVKMIEIIALLKDELRKLKIEAAEASLALSGKDLIIRTFELPILPQEEMHTAVNFEVKKYIPFKVEDLISGFQTQIDKLTRKSLVLFVGIKKDTLDRYISILNELNIKIMGVEYSAFSLMRLLALSGVKTKGVLGIVAADLSEQDEANFTVMENGFPLFSRDITLGSSPAADLGGPAEPGAGLDLEKLKTEVRISLDYYHRKFPAKAIQKVYFISRPEYQPELEGFMVELGLAGQFTDISKALGMDIIFSLSLIKGLAASFYAAVKSQIKIDLLSAKTKKAGAVTAGKDKDLGKEFAQLAEGMRLDKRFIAAGLLICAAVFGYGFYKKQVVLRDIAVIESQRPQVASASANMEYEQLKAQSEEMTKKLFSFDNLVGKQLYVTEQLAAIPRIIPDGIWLTNLTLNTREGVTIIQFDGMAYLEDASKEFQAVNAFLENLKADSQINKGFKDIAITSMDQRPFGSKTVATGFRITAKTKKETR